jgi:hypothetical protein
MVFNNKKNTTLNGIIILIVLCISLSLYVFSLDTEINNQSQNGTSLLSNLEQFTNQTYQDVIFKERKGKLITQIKKYKELDLPININDNGNMCQDWNKDPKKRYPNSGNTCQLVDNDAICINNNKKVSTCNKIYNRQIKEIATIDINQIINTNFNQLVPLFKEVDKVIAKKELILYTLINQLIQLKNTKYQQEYFLSMNKDYLSNANTRKKNIEETHELENNKYGINSNNFKLYKEDINNLSHTRGKYNTYLSIVGYLLIIVVAAYFLSLRA